jgi:lysyl-tRNA synthetase class 2
LKYNPQLKANDLSAENAKKTAKKLGIHLKDSWGLGRIQIEIFEATVEEKLIQPTFITQYPTEVSPLSRCNDENPFTTDRFELFIGGREIANGFSELNDAEEQAQRFQDQTKEKDAGNDEAMYYDADYIRALEYGMPPTAGEGIGVDRLVMFFTNSPSIRDVLLFPHMRPE